MALADRRALIAELEKLRGSRIVTLVTSDRYSTCQINGIQAQIAADQIHQIVRHLKALTREASIPRLDLFIYSRGGDTNSAWPLVNSIRNYAPEFNVLVAVHAHSAATLISLGANKIVMTKTASLSPIDPTVANSFNPKENGQAQGISVEDVTSFFDLARDEKKVDIKSENNITEVFKLLAGKVHPLALGNVKRSHSQIRHLARKLLCLHMQDEDGKGQIDSIVDALTERFYTHNHSIFRQEAKKTGLDGIVVDASDKEEELLWLLYSDYEREMHLKEFFDPGAFLAGDDEKLLTTTPVILESGLLATHLVMTQKVKRALPPDPGYRLQVLAQAGPLSHNAKALKTQLLQVRANLTQLCAHLAQLIQQSQAHAAQAGQPVSQNTPLHAVLNGAVGLDNELNTLIGQIPGEIDLSTLNKSIEFELQSLAWVDN